MSIINFLVHMSNSHAATFPFATKTIPAAVLLLLLNCQAQAQTASTDAGAPTQPAAKTKPAAKPADKAADRAAADKISADTPQAPGQIATVNVVSERQTNRIDRQVYDIKNDATTAGASIGDVLNNVPSVNVDPNGTVRLRGSERVTVLVDGKPTAQLQGENRAAAINALPAENYESVQVINNPGAEFGNEAGGGPILNLISRRYTKPGGNGSMAGTIGPGGRASAFANGSYSAGYASVNGTLNLRRDGNDIDTEQQREAIDPSTGAVSRLRQTSASHGLNSFVQAGVGGRYNYSESDTLTASVSANKRGNDASAEQHVTDFRTSQVPQIDYRTHRKTDGDATNYELVTGFERRFKTDGESLKVDLRHSSNTNNGDTAVLYQNTPTGCACGPVLRDYAQDAETRTRLTDLSTDYTGKSGPGFLSAGARWQRTQITADNRYLFLPAGSLDTRRSNLFDLDQDVLAVYGTYELPLNTLWSFKGGLRVERTDQELDQVTTGIQATNQYTSYLPSLFLSYKLDANSKLRLSYADRISRPMAAELNPFVNYANDYYVSSGNPHLHAVKLHSLELGYETKIMGLAPASLRGYLRRESDVITERRVFLDQNTLLTTRENLGDRRSGGIEFSLMGMLPPNWRPGGIKMPNIRFMFSGNWGFIEQDRVGALGLTGEKRSSPSLQLQGGGQWLINENNTVNVFGHRQGKLLSGEGYREPFGMMTLAYEHKFDKRLSLNIRAMDVLNSTGQKFRVETDTLRDRTDTTVHQRRVYVGMRYTFGGTTGNDAVRNAMASAGINVDSPQAREAMKRAQEMQAAQAAAEKAAAEKAPQPQPPQK